MTRTIHQTALFAAPPVEVYDALMDSEKTARFTGLEADISRETGGAFSVYGGGLRGKNLELIPGKRIVQTWRASEAAWPADHYSILTVVLEPVEEGTRVQLTQADVPDACYDTINDGWQKHYWAKMRAAFGW